MKKFQNIQGRVWRLGDNINTDMIHPSQYFSLDEATLKNGIKEGMARLQKGGTPVDGVKDLVIVAGKNFGCGSSRESSVRALFASGVKAIVAQSFARIFYRSLVNRGIVPIVCKKAHEYATDGDGIEIHMDEQCILLNDSEKIPFIPFDLHIKNILECGGLIPYMENEK